MGVHCWYEDQYFDIGLDTKSNRDNLLYKVIQRSYSLVTIKKKGQELLSTQQLRWISIVWHWPLNKRPENQLGSSTRTRCKHCSNINVRFKCWAEYLFEDQLFDLDPNINLGHLRTRNIRCIKLGNFQANASKDIERTTFPKTSSLTLTFGYVTWNQYWSSSL